MPVDVAVSSAQCEAAGMQPPAPDDRPLQPPSRVFITLLFDKEADHLLTYLLEVGDVADAIVIVEANVTFSGRPKPLGFDLFRSQFSRWEDKLVHAVVTDLNQVSDAWDKEAHSRSAGLQAVKQHLSPSPQDWVLMLDVDELVSRSTVLALKGCTWELGTDTVLRLRLRSSAFAVACRYANTPVEFQPNAFAMTWDYVQRISIPEAARTRQAGPVARNFEDAGWQLSWMLSLQQTLAKIEAFSHQELNNPHVKNVTRIRQAYRGGTDLYGREDVPACTNRPLDQLQPPAPQAVTANKGYFCGRGWIRGDDCPDGAVRGGVGDRDERND